MCHTTLLDGILKGKDIQYTIAVIQKCVTSGFTSAGAKSKKAEDAGKGPSLTNPVDVLKKIEVRFSSYYKNILQPFHLLSLLNDLWIWQSQAQHTG